ncbi:GPI transamidase subunit PIG-U-domain-containing protein [Blastocladiella britannica]|nr:GPI transamidase subunit PIG-U-domain-containing protein [Blastocladiella britannica]
MVVPPPLPPVTIPLTWRRGRVIGAIAMGLAVRGALLFLLPSLEATLLAFVPLRTAMTGWKRFQEGLFLYRAGMPLYDNDLFHGSPVLLPLFASVPDLWHPVLFALADAAIALAIALVAERQPLLEPLAYAHTTATSNKNINVSASWRHRIGGGIVWSPELMALVYLLNPLTIAAGLARDVGVFERVLVAGAAASASLGDSIWSSGYIALAFLLGLHPIVMLPIVALIERRATHLSAHALIPAMLIQVGAWIMMWSMFATHALGMDPWHIANATLGFLWRVPDMTPNVGLWWYFLMEVFDHFREFFVFVFHAHVFMYLAPVLLRYGKELPVFAFVVYLGILAALRPYPTAGDWALWIGFLPLYATTWKYHRYSYLTSSLVLFTGLLYPTMYVLWTHLGSGNANFPYSLTLLAGVTATLLLADLMHGMLVHTHAVDVRVACADAALAAVAAAKAKAEESLSSSDEDEKKKEDEKSETDPSTTTPPPPPIDPWTEYPSAILFASE